jgi:hypothetical protein
VARLGSNFKAIVHASGIDIISAESGHTLLE